MNFIQIYSYSIFLNLVGEPLDNKVLNWFRQNIGNDKCKFVDTWWQTGRAIQLYKLILTWYNKLLLTEVGGIAIIVEHNLEDLPSDNFPSKPFFGVDPVITDNDQVIK